jgi:hypothetical protein
VAAPEHPALTADDVIARGGWHPRYARVLALASDGDYGLAVVDGNGDGAELEEEQWLWDAEQGWLPGTSSGSGPLETLASVETGGQIGDTHYAYGRVRGASSVRVSFGGRVYPVPAATDGVWAFVQHSSGAGSCDPPALIL